MEKPATLWLRDWDSGGAHRTGTAEDHASADWLVRAAEALNAKPEIETFSLSRIDPVACFVEGDGFRIPGVPVFDSPPTGPDGAAGEVKIVSLSPHAVYSGDFRALRQASDHTALVIVCQGQEPGLGLLNAEQFNTPYGQPAIHIAETPPGPVKRVVSEYRRVTAEGRNVVVTIPGRVRSRRPVVVMTPRSSWWQSTSERGGGLVCWLETLRGQMAARPARDVVMTANSGHELGHLGLDAFLARRPGWDKADGAAWVHYGANIGAAGGTLSVVSNDDAMRDMMRRILNLTGQTPAVAPAGQVPFGETRDIHRDGGRYVTLIGTNRLFHLPRDRWPDAVDVPAIEHIAAASSVFVRALTAEGGFDQTILLP